MRNMMRAIPGKRRTRLRVGDRSVTVHRLTKGAFCRNFLLRISTEECHIRRMKALSAKTKILLVTTLSAWLINPLSAGDAIMPYKETGKSGQFSYAIYNNRWLLQGRQAIDEKNITRVAITGMLPGAKGKLVIPSSIEGHEVYGIDERAFESCREVTEIVIPKTVRFLRPGTLNRCQGLENIIVAEDHPDFASVDGVMFDKQKTMLLVVGHGREGHFDVPATTTVIGQSAFAHCALLKSVSIPKGVTDIGGRSGGVFEGCKNLERIDIPDTVTNIGQKSFLDCISLKQVTIPPKITEIPFGLFWRCGNLAAVDLPDGITSIGNYAFADCAQLKLEGFPKSLTTVGAYAFKNCKALKGLTVPNRVTTIGNGAFSGCDVKLPTLGDA